MESKFVSKAKSAFQNAAAKAERVLTEIKADFVAEFSSNSHGERGQLPWIGKSDREKDLEGECRKRILEITESSDFLHEQDEAKVDVDMQSAMAVLELDENLRELRYHWVPKLMKEKEFWRCYFSAVKRVKNELFSEPMNPSTEARVPESPRKDPSEEDAYKKAMTVIAIPPSVVIRRLSSAIEAGKAYESMVDLAASGSTQKELSQSAEWSSLVSGLKKFSMRDKKTQNKNTEMLQSLLSSLFDSDFQYEAINPKADNKSRLPEELHGAPPQSFIAHLAEIIAGFKSEQKMAEFWLEIVKECRRRWESGEPVPRLPVDSNPNLNYCLLLQQLQVINCCMARRKRRLAAVESLQDDHQQLGDDISSSLHQARLNNGELVPRMCVDHRAENLNLNMLETGEPIYSPITQEGPVLTEESIKENEELVLRTGSFGAGCSQLFSDMQAFKAANPGCILEDFVRWYSPLDWREDSPALQKENEPFSRGSLSTRMKSEGNLWQELWLSARPVPAVSQAPLFDEELAGESSLDALENIAPADFFEQLFTTALSAGFAIAETSSPSRDPLKRCLKECTDYILSTCHRHMDSATLDHLCQVYELMESAVHAPPPEEQPEKEKEKVSEPRTESSSMSDLRKFLQRKQNVDEPQTRAGPVSSVVKFFEGKSSLFDRKSKQQQQQQSSGIVAVDEKKLCSIESGEWTLV